MLRRKLKLIVYQCKVRKTHSENCNNTCVLIFKDPRGTWEGGIAVNFRRKYRAVTKCRGNIACSCRGRYPNPEYRENVSVQFRSSRTAKGKFGFSTQCCVIEKWNHHRDNFPCISSTQRKNNSVQKYLYRLSNVHRPKKSGNPMHSSQRIFHDFHPSPKWRGVVRQWRWNGARWWPFIRPWPRRDACRCRW